MPPQPAETLTIADIIAARSDYYLSKRKRSDLKTIDTSWRWTLGPLLGVITVGSAVGAGIPPGSYLPGFLGRFSNVLGWVYFLFWALAEYPSLYYNFCQKSVSGDTLDQIVYYLIGDASYTAFTCILLWSKLCHSDREGCRGRADSIHLNDALFSIHSTVCTLALLGQLLAYTPRSVEISLQCWVVIVSVAVIGSGGLILALQDSSFLTVPAYLYGISFLRVGSCVMELMPSSADANLQGEIGSEKDPRVAAQGPLLLGGLLSIAQQLLDATASGIWSILYGNLTKAAIALLTTAFSTAVLLRENKAGVAFTCSSRAEAAEHSEPLRGRADELTEALVDASQV